MLTPPHGRKAWPLIVWMAIATTLALSKMSDMAAFTMLLVATYLRPVSLMPILRKHLVRPLPPTMQFWTILVADQDEGVANKVGVYDQSVTLDFPWLPSLVKVVEVLAEGDPDEKVWQFEYPQYLKEFKIALKTLQLPAISPYQARHSGASIDRAGLHRTSRDVQKRGGWQQAQSVARYEKSSRMAADYHALPPATKLLIERRGPLLVEQLLGAGAH